MKNRIASIAILFGTAFFFQGCQGPEGPEGPQGPAGADGLIAAAYELPANFTAANDYGIGADFPSTIEVLESDAVMVYRASGEVPISGQSPAIIWQALPQVRTSGQGIFMYNFNHTFFDLEIFLDGNVNFGTLESKWTQNQLFRVVIIPADYINARKAPVDLNNYEEVAKAFGIDESKVKVLH